MLSTFIYPKTLIQLNSLNYSILLRIIILNIEESKGQSIATIYIYTYIYI
jgi:hypothetical protein